MKVGLLFNFHMFILVDKYDVVLIYLAHKWTLNSGYVKNLMLFILKEP